MSKRFLEADRSSPFGEEASSSGETLRFSKHLRRNRRVFPSGPYGGVDLATVGARRSGERKDGEMTEPLPPPLQADSPVTLPDGRNVPRYRPPEVGGGSFTVNLDQAPQAIRELEEALRELQEIREDAQALGRINPPTRDLVSADAAQVLGLTAAGGPGSLVEALTIGMEHVQGMITNLRIALEQSYPQSDEDISAAFDSSP